MGGLQQADPGNAIGGGVKRVWSYLKLLRTESTGIRVNVNVNVNIILSTPLRAFQG